MSRLTTASMQSKFRFMRFYISILFSLAFCKSAASAGESYSWQPAQHNKRFRNGDYQTRISEEISCKDRCVRTPTCIGVDWHTAYSSCFLFYNSEDSLLSQSGFRHWRITRNSSLVTLATTTPLGSATSIVNTDEIDYSSTTTASSAADASDFYSWQPVQKNKRMRTGEFRPDIHNETACKAECLKSPSCAGIYWYDPKNLCNFHTDCKAPLDHEEGFRLWRIQKYTPTAATCESLTGASKGNFKDVEELSLNCDPRDNLAKAVIALAVILSAATMVIIVLLFNTCRLNRKIRKYAFMAADIQLVQQVEQPRYESNNNCPRQPAGYMMMLGTQTPIPSDNENLYDDIDEARRHH